MKTKNYGFFILFSLLLLSTTVLKAQVELVPSSNKVYDFLDRMSVNGIIENYSSSMVPISRREIARYLKEIKSKSGKISRTDKKFLDDYFVEFEYLGRSSHLKRIAPNPIYRIIIGIHSSSICPLIPHHWRPQINNISN